MSGVVAIQANIGQGSLGTAFSGALQQVVEVLLAQKEHVVDQDRLLWVSHG